MAYPYKPLDLSKNEIRILKILDSTALQQPELVHCSLHHVSLDDVHPKFKAFKDEMESIFKQPMKGDYATKCWTFPDSESSTPETAAMREQDPEMSDNLHLHTQPSIAHWRYEADNSDEARKHLVETLSIDASTLPPRPQQKFPQRRSETVSPRPVKPQTFKIKPRFTWGDYESISYCWESDIREKAVIVDGVLVRVPKNLKFLLQKLQHLPEASSGMGFWVDGLCIDQDNTLEKNHQVYLMHHIYSQSFATIVWLGSSCEGSNRAMDLMAQIAEINMEIEDELDIDPWISHLPWEDVYAVLTRSYWKRMWIIQELALNTHMTLFLCGERQLPRGAISSTCRFCFDSHARAISEALANRRADPQTRFVVPEYDTWQAADDVFNLFRLEGGVLVSQRPKLETILDLARKANVKDPRDKIYGILGLLPLSLSSKIKSNYTLSEGQVYVHFATALLESCESLDEILSWCAYVPHSSLTSRVSDQLWPSTSGIADWRQPYTSLYGHLVGDMLPSWVPDWTKHFPRRHLQWLRKSFASGQMRLPYTIIGRELHCRGIRVDSIQSISFSPTQSRPYRTVGHAGFTSSTQEATYHRYTDMNGLAKALNWTLLMSHPRAMDASVLDVYWINWEQLDGPNNGADTQVAQLWTYAMAEITRTDPDMTFDPWESFDRFRHRNANFMLFGHAFKSFFPNMRSYKIPSSPHATHLPLNYIEHLKGNTHNLTKGHARNVKIVAIGLEGRKLVTTTTGFLGMAPEETHIGDVLAMLIGCNFPVVLRPFGSGYSYIGECYVAGLMRGEGVDALERGEYQAIDITLH